MKGIKHRNHPCCGFFLQGAAKLVALADIPLMLVGVGLLILDMITIHDRVERHRRENYRLYIAQIVLWTCYWLHAFITLSLVPVLFFGTIKRNIVFVRIWLWITPINLIMGIIIYWYNTYLFGIHLPTITLYNVYMLIKMYTLWVIWEYLRELRICGELNAALRNLTDAEVEQFHLGNSENIPNAINGAARAPLEPYKKDFEIDISRLYIDEERILGKGAYGCVYRGVLTTRINDQVEIAVKTIHSTNISVVCFKALLTELKIMTYVGHHPNIVSLIGACTELIKERKLYVVVELCALGSLEDYLRSSRALFVNQLFQGRLQKQCEESNMDEEALSTRVLINMTLGLALGMEYLESKKIIHGDLATRNVLLTADRTVKISDFGLAKQLYQYSVYVRTQNTPLPWRWLSLESITDMEFSSKSDVWSFAVTLWEMFTLGEVPWGTCQFSSSFISDLKGGKRLSQPPNSPTELYHLMRLCWSSKPDERPPFSDIVAVLRSMISECSVTANNNKLV